MCKPVVWHFSNFFCLYSCIVLKHRGILCGPVADGYESRTIPNDLKDDHDNRRNQQVYSASPVKTVDKTNDSGMYISYYMKMLNPPFTSCCETSISHNNQ